MKSRQAIYHQTVDPNAKLVRVVFICGRQPGDRPTDRPTGRSHHSQPSTTTTPKTHNLGHKQEDTDKFPFCAEINEKAFHWALDRAPQRTKERFAAKGVWPVFDPDIV